MNHIGTKTIETDRLLLRRLTKNDAYKAFQNWCSKDKVVEYLLWKKHESIETTLNQFDGWEKEYDDLKTYRWIIELKENYDLIGIIDLGKGFLRFDSCEIGYCYSDKYWGNGYATESLNAVIKYLFEECDAKTVFAEYMSENIASGKVLEKVNMKYEGVLRSRVVDKNGKRNDLISYSITKEEYLGNLKR